MKLSFLGKWWQVPKKIMKNQGENKIKIKNNTIASRDYYWDCGLLMKLSNIYISNPKGSITN